MSVSAILAKRVDTSVVEGEDSLEYDLGLLSAFDFGSLDSSAFNEQTGSYLLSMSRDNVQRLVNKLFALPQEEIKGEIGRLAVLPAPTTKLPREKPVPKGKAMTKWEQFAKQKGIEKKKKGGKVWDEELKDWRPRYGYNRANDASQATIIEHREGDDPSLDPWTKMSHEKRARIQKNQAQQERNSVRIAAASDSTGKAGAAAADFQLSRAVPGQLNLADAAASSVRKRKKESEDDGGNRKRHKAEKRHVDVCVLMRSTISTYFLLACKCRWRCQLLSRARLLLADSIRSVKLSLR